jgi:hypothetical protein
VFQRGLKPANRASNHAAGGDDPPRSADSWRLLAKVSFNPLYVVRGPSQAKLGPRGTIFRRHKPVSARDLGLVAQIGDSLQVANAEPPVSRHFPKPMRQNALQRKSASAAPSIRSLGPLTRIQPIQSTQFGQKWGLRTSDWVILTRTLDVRGAPRQESDRTTGRSAPFEEPNSTTLIGAHWRVTHDHRTTLETRCEPQRFSSMSELRRLTRSIGGCGRSSAPYNHGSTNF